MRNQLAKFCLFVLLITTPVVFNACTGTWDNLVEISDTLCDLKECCIRAHTSGPDTVYSCVSNDLGARACNCQNKEHFAFRCLATQTKNWRDVVGERRTEIDVDDIDQKRPHPADCEKEIENSCGAPKEQTRSADASVKPESLGQGNLRMLEESN